MHIRKIVCCCGSGLGSSLIVQMNLEKVLDELGIVGIQVEHTALSECFEYMADLFVIGKDLVNEFQTFPRTVVLSEIVSKEELKEKMIRVFDMEEDVYCLE